MVHGKIMALGTILILLAIQGALCAGPPRMERSFMAFGEITQPLKDLAGFELQAAFEESYDAESRNAAFVVWMVGENVTFVKSFGTNQTFKYTEGKACEETTEREWLQSQYPPGLLAYETDDGSVRFSLRQLFNLPDKYLTAQWQDKPAVYRGVPARVWMYEIPGRDERGVRRKLNVYAYWSDGTWTTSSNEKQVPLAFVVDRMQWSQKVKVDETVISVFGFVSQTYDRRLFEPFQGIVCENRTKTRKFPSVEDLKTISLHSELVFPDYQEIRYIDTWFDPKNELVRMDAARLREEDPIAERKTKKYQSEVVSGMLGLVFRQTVFKERFQCEVVPFEKYQSDMQNLVDVKQDLRKWKMGKLFGLNDTEYVYTGKTVKSLVPCHLFQGIRKDWPDESANVTSLWEWCFNSNMSKENDVVMFTKDELGLVSAQVKILSSGQPQDYPVGFRLYHHFYDITIPEPALLDAKTFDIGRCFSDTEKRMLQFYLDWKIDENNIVAAENLTSDLVFLQKWKSVLCMSSKLPSYYLRISNVQATIADKKMYIKFTILGKHSQLPAKVSLNQIGLYEAEKNVRDNEAKLAITHVTSRGSAATTFRAARGSITNQINPDFEHHTIAPPPPTTPTHSTDFPFSLRTEPTKDHSKSTPDGSTPQTSTGGTGNTIPGSSESTGSTNSVSPSPIHPTNEPQHTKKEGHKPGTVALVSVLTLLAGVGVGSAGTFYKFFGLPSWVPIGQN